MKKLPISLFLLFVISSAFADGGRPRSCNELTNGVLPEAMPWLPQGANQNACSQMMLSTLAPSSARDASDKVAAFKDGKLTGIRDRFIRNSWSVTFDPSVWQESAAIGPFGELWWGRSSNNLVIVGQESYVRLAKGFPTLSKEETADHMAEIQRQIAALKNHQAPPPALIVPDKSGLFSQPVLEYKQISAAMTSFQGGLGGEGTIPLGKVSNAKLKLETNPFLKGVLTFDLDVDGTVRTFALPLVRNVFKAHTTTLPPPEEKFRLRGAVVVNGEYYRCDERPSSVRTPYSTPSCEYPRIAQNATESYDAYGAFFGDHASLAAIQFRLVVNSPVRNRHGATAMGLIVLQDVQRTK